MKIAAAAACWLLGMNLEIVIRYGHRTSAGALVCDRNGQIFLYSFHCQILQAGKEVRPQRGEHAGAYSRIGRARPVRLLLVNIGLGNNGPFSE